jgi:hypothetical protein
MEVGDDQRLLGLAEDFCRTVNHDLGYESYVKGVAKQSNTSFDRMRITKFDILRTLQTKSEEESSLKTIDSLFSFIATQIRSKREAALVT